MAKKILIVEDNEVNRVLMRDLLTYHGYEIIEAADGAEGIAKAKEYSPDLILMDLVMPGMNGRELAQEVALRKMTPRTLFVSGYTDDAIVRLGMLQPGLAFLNKPFSPEALLRKMREILDGPVEKAKP